MCDQLCLPFFLSSPVYWYSIAFQIWPGLLKIPLVQYLSIRHIHGNQGIANLTYHLFPWILSEINFLQCLWNFIFLWSINWSFQSALFHQTSFDTLLLMIICSLPIIPSKYQDCWLWNAVYFYNYPILRGALSRSARWARLIHSDVQYGQARIEKSARPSQRYPFIPLRKVKVHINQHDFHYLQTKLYEFVQSKCSA